MYKVVIQSPYMFAEYTMLLDELLYLRKRCKGKGVEIKASPVPHKSAKAIIKEWNL